MKSVLQNLLGAVSTILLVVHTLLIGIFVFFLSFWKYVLPEAICRPLVNPLIVGVANVWLAVILWWLEKVLRIRFEVENQAELSMKNWYILISNHQSWVDIFALFYVAKGKIPLLKFFVKKELAYMPVVGQAWWALDYPFMGRYSAAAVAKNPDKKNHDLKATQKACEKFSYVPTSVVNFIEGTRFTAEKHRRQKMPYKHLLRPKAAGIAFAIQALGAKFSSMIDATIVYQGAPPTFWDLGCGRVGAVIIRVRQVAIPERFINMDYQNNRADKKAFQQWLHELWQLKDEHISQIKAAR